MCGIVGFITNEKWKSASDRRNFMEQALIIDILRGEDSTGVFYGHLLDAHAGYLKDAVDGYQFVNKKDYRDLVRKMENIKFMVGHNRAATIGNISVETAHPFVAGGRNVIGVHNGTVRGGMRDLPLPMASLPDVTVDSECIIRNLAHVDPADAITHVVSKIDGAFMLVWHDVRDGSLNFARNDTRVFHLAQSYTEQTIYFASEAGQLQWLCDRNQLGTADYYALKPGQHLKFTTEGGLKPRVREFTPAPKWSAPAPRPAPAPATSGGAGGTSLGKPPAPTFYPSDHRVKLGGILREVPQLMQEELLEHGLAVEDSIVVTPMARQSEKNTWSPAGLRYVTCYSDRLDLTFLVHGVESWVAENGFERRWTVQPTGVMYMHPDKKNPVILARLRASVSQVEKLTLIDADSSPSSTGTSSPEPADDMLLGPRGEYISKREWILLTQGGCVDCNKTLTTGEAESIHWYNDEPQCHYCYEFDMKMIANSERWHDDDLPWGPAYDTTIH